MSSEPAVKRDRASASLRWRAVTGRAGRMQAPSIPEDPPWRGAGRRA